MPVKVNEQIPRSIMFLCLGTSFVLLLGYWSGVNDRITPKPMGIVKAASKQAPKVEVSKSVVTPMSQSSVSQPSISQTPIPQTDAKLVVSLSDRRVYLYKESQRLATYPLAVAQEGWETPTGTFQVFNMEKNPTWIHPITEIAVPPGPDNPLGVAWIGFWTDGETEIGFHGTNQEELIGEAVSHGCLRMRNADIQALYAHVSTGTPVIVQP